jgi:hypothetical protein
MMDTEKDELLVIKRVRLIIGIALEVVPKLSSSGAYVKFVGKMFLLRITFSVCELNELLFMISESV